MEKLAELKSQLSGLIALATKALEGDKPDMEKYNEYLPQIEELEEQIKAVVKLEDAKKLAAAPANGASKKATPLPIAPDGEEIPPSEEEELKARQAAVTQAVHIARFGDVDAAIVPIAREIYGDDYMQLCADQAKAFDVYVRSGKDGLRHQGIDDRVLCRQLWDVADVKDMLKADLGVAAIKATMVEGTDILGGYAVPPQRSRVILRRIAGLTAVRRAGALIIQTDSKSIDWMKITGGGTQYPSAMRGAWGHETQSPGGDDFSLGLESIPVEIYTYKVPFSVSLLEDAANLMDIFSRLVADTLSMDEDVVFVQGDGANKPRGILPGGDGSLEGIAVRTHAGTGTAGEIEVDELKLLRREIASQYRAAGRASWVWASATGGVVETFQDGIGRFYYDYTEDTERFLRGTVYETEAMPALASGSYSVLYGDFSGYAVVERLGLAVVRYNDSNTGVNTVEFHVRRRIGGRVIEPWKLAVLRASTA